MNRWMCACACVISSVTMLDAGPDPVFVETRFVGADGASGPFSGRVIDGQYTVDLVLQARLVGDPLAFSLSVMEFDFTDSEQGTSPVPFGQAPLTIGDAFPDLIGLPGIDVEAPDPDGRAGLFPVYRSFAGANNEEPSNGRVSDAGYRVTPAAWARASASATADEWSSVFKLRWRTPDLQSRPVEVVADGSFASYWQEFDLVQPIVVNDTSAQILVMPTPGASLLVLAAGGIVAGRRRR